MEIPEFLDSSTNEVKVVHNVPEFESEWGWGLDAEFHIPAPGGFLTLRGTMNRGFDPNP